MARAAAPLAFALALAGCASVPMGDAERDAALKTFQAPADRAGVYVYRNELSGGRMHVEIDGVAVGDTVARTYLHAEVAPGRHTITSRAENVHSIEIDAEPGTLYFVRQEVRPGFWSARTRLHRVDADEGRKGVQQTKLTAAAAPPPLQTLAVQVEADDPAWRGPLACTAANAAGEWPFTAPGPLTVRPSATPLRIACDLPAGASAEPSVTSSQAGRSVGDSARHGAATGAKVGGGAGAALGIAAAPVMGPAFAVLLVVGGAMRGAEIGSMVGASTSTGPSWAYPGMIVLHVRAAAPAAEAAR